MTSSNFKKYPRTYRNGGLSFGAIEEEDSENNSLDKLKEMNADEIAQNSPMGRLTAEERDNLPFKYGKYQGYTPHQILDEDPEYIKNVYELTNTTGKVTRLSKNLYQLAIFAIEDANAEEAYDRRELRFDSYEDDFQFF